MNNDFATAMSRALARTRAGDLGKATQILQTALNGNAATERTGPDAAQKPSAGVGRTLGQVVDELFAKRTIPVQGKNSRTIVPEIPDGASYRNRRHDSPHGARDCRVFVPSSRDVSPDGLLLMLHGCTQGADDFAVGTAMNLHAERHNLVVVYPDQSRQANQMGCWNWFRAEDQQRGRGEPALLADMATTLASEFNIPAGAIYAAGLSAGAAMAAILGDTYPDIFAAIGIHSGLAPAAANDLPTAFAAMRGEAPAARKARSRPVRSIVFHGTADTTVVPSNADAVITAALGEAVSVEIVDTSVTGATVTLHRDPAGVTLAENWTLPGIGHAWSGGSPDGSYTDPTGPDASSEMLRFFMSVAAERRA